MTTTIQPPARPQRERVQAAHGATDPRHLAMRMALARILMLTGSAWTLAVQNRFQTTRNLTQGDAASNVLNSSQPEWERPAAVRLAPKVQSYPANSQAEGPFRYELSGEKALMA